MVTTQTDSCIEFLDELGDHSDFELFPHHYQPKYKLDSLQDVLLNKYWLHFTNIFEEEFPESWQPKYLHSFSSKPIKLSRYSFQQFEIYRGVTLNYLSGCLKNVNYYSSREFIDAFELIKIIHSYPQCPILVANFVVTLKSLGIAEAVVCHGHDGELTIWTIVNNTTLDQRYLIFDHQWEIMQRYKGVRVEFNLIDRGDIPLENIATWNENTIIISL